MTKIGTQKSFWKKFSLKKERRRSERVKLGPLIDRLIMTLSTPEPSQEEKILLGGNLSSSFLEELAKAQPDPGGGAAAAYSIILSLALVEKVVRLELRLAQTKLDRIYLWETSLIQLSQLKEVFSQLQQEDVQAYLNLTNVRTQWVQGEELFTALDKAVTCPLKIMRQAQVALDLVSWIGSLCRKHLVSDLLVSCEIIRAALQGAYHLANANLQFANVEDNAWREARSQELLRASQEGRELFLGIRKKLVSRMMLAEKIDFWDAKNIPAGYMGG
jgi:formiminotetrahydrofolate cyclodeaminase